MNLDGSIIRAAVRAKCCNMPHQQVATLQRLVAYFWCQVRCVSRDVGVLYTQVLALLFIHTRGLLSGLALQPCGQRKVEELHSTLLKVFRAPAPDFIVLH